MRYPYRLFLLLDPVLAHTILGDPPCMKDRYSKAFFEKYGPDCCSSLAIALLEFLASLIKLDITDIECRHAVLRRNCLRAVQTWAKSFEQVAADVCAQLWRLVEQDPFSNDTDKPKSAIRRAAPKLDRRPSNKARAVKRRAAQAALGLFGHTGTVNSWNVFF